MNYWLTPMSGSDQYGAISALSPVINVANSLPQVTKMVSIMKNCGRDNICTPDLELYPTL